MTKTQKATSQKHLVYPRMDGYANTRRELSQTKTVCRNSCLHVWVMSHAMPAGLHCHLSISTTWNWLVQWEEVRTKQNQSNRRLPGGFGGTSAKMPLNAANMFVWESWHYAYCCQQKVPVHACRSRMENVILPTTSPRNKAWSEAVVWVNNWELSWSGTVCLPRCSVCPLGLEQ